MQIGVNTIAILGGIVGEGMTPHFAAVIAWVLAPEMAARVAFAASFATVTALFVVLADLVPKRLSLNEPSAWPWP